MDIMDMTPRRPYLLRAHYDWLLDNNLTPHLVVDVSMVGVDVPLEYAQDGQIVLNIAPRAVGNLDISNDAVQFNARFGGVPRQVYVPIAAVIAVYARENGAGMMFEPEPAYEEDGAEFNDDISQPTEGLSLVREETQSDNNSDDDSSPEPPKPPRGKPALRVVK